MDKVWIIITAIAIFSIINLIHYKVMKGFVKESFGKKWLSIWGNKVYFWQSSIFFSTAGTVLAMCILKWLNILTF